MSEVLDVGGCEVISPGSLAIVIAPRHRVARLVDPASGPIGRLREGSVALVVGVHPEDSAGTGALFMVVSDGRAGWVRKYNLRFV